VAKSYSSSAILKHWKAGTDCACSAVFETCLRSAQSSFSFPTAGQGERSSGNEIACVNTAVKRLRMCEQ